MTAPLYDVKNKFSEYVKIAESGEPVEISKRGKTTVVLVRVEDYTVPGEKPVSMFEKVHNAWLKRWGGGLTDEEYDEFWGELERDRHRPKPERPIPFIDY